MLCYGIKKEICDTDTDIFFSSFSNSFRHSLQHNTMEDLEKTYERFILQQVDWDQLPIDTKKSMGNSKETWKQNVVRFSIRHQLRWKTNLVRLYVSEEKMYYQEILRFSRAHFMASRKLQKNNKNLFSRISIY